MHIIKLSHVDRIQLPTKMLPFCCFPLGFFGGGSPDKHGKSGLASEMLFRRIPKFTIFWSFLVAFWFLMFFGYWLFVLSRGFRFDRWQGDLLFLGPLHCRLEWVFSHHDTATKASSHRAQVLVEDNPAKEAVSLRQLYSSLLDVSSSGQVHVGCTQNFYPFAWNMAPCCSKALASLFILRGDMRRQLTSTVFYLVSLIGQFVSWLQEGINAAMDADDMNDSCIFMNTLILGRKHIQLQQVP